jgi:hypothetical protein
VRNPKIEIRDPKEIRNPKTEIRSGGAAAVSRTEIVAVRFWREAALEPLTDEAISLARLADSNAFRYSDFEFRISFGSRISDFEFHPHTLSYA